MIKTVMIFYFKFSGLLIELNNDVKIKLINLTEKLVNGNNALK